jgi:tRNA dimethylallyltransferase
MAAGEIKSVLEQGHHPVVVGGTGLYLRALTEGLSDMPDVPPGIRDEIVVLQKKLGNSAFHQALQNLDPVMAARLNPNDTQRLIRAYEVIKATGESLAVWQARPLQGPPESWRFKIIIKTPDRAELHHRCDRRFDTMIQTGAMEEVAVHLDLPEDAPLSHALGFRPLRDYLKDRIVLEEALKLGKAETRQYAKRQDTWFRHQVRPNPAIDEIVRIP